jgi:phage shock protein PspC (stress-responsive transcriptional regulator)
MKPLPIVARRPQLLFRAARTIDSFRQDTMLITPRKIIEIVLSRKTKSASFRPYETTTQRSLFFGALITVCAGVLAGIASKLLHQPNVAIGALVLILVSQLLAAAYQIASIAPEFEKLRNIERQISNPFVAEFNDDLDLVNEIAGIGEVHHLSFAESSFRLMAKQLRERIAILVGALDKVGVIPLVVTAYLSWVKIQKEGLMFEGIQWFSVALVALYLFAIRMTSAAQWMERVAELFALARVSRAVNES